MVGINFAKLTLGQRYDAIEGIIRDIKEGKRKHNQSVYHGFDSVDCGTAHCISGWAEIEEVEALGLSIEDEEIYRFVMDLDEEGRELLP